MLVYIRLTDEDFAWCGKKQQVGNDQDSIRNQKKIPTPKT